MLPLAILVLGALIVVWRGLGKGSDDTSNRAKGGGAHWHGDGH